MLFDAKGATANPRFSLGTIGFGFLINGDSNLVVIVEACTNVANRDWTVLSTNALLGGTSYFNDPAWRNFPFRYYRVSPGFLLTNSLSLSYIVNNNEVKITGYNGTARAANIPETID